MALSAHSVQLDAETKYERCVACIATWQTSAL